MDFITSGNVIWYHNRNSSKVIVFWQGNGILLHNKILLMDWNHITFSNEMKLWNITKFGHMEC